MTDYRSTDDARLLDHVTTTLDAIRDAYPASSKRRQEQLLDELDVLAESLVGHQSPEATRLKATLSDFIESLHHRTAQ